MGRRGSIKQKIRKIVIGIVASLLSVVVTLVIVELILRVTHLGGAKRSWAQPDSQLGYRFSPNSKYWHHEENDHPITGRINKYGWRDEDWELDKPSQQYRIAVLGDSFVEAFQVEQDSTFHSLVEKQLSKQAGRNVEMMNFGRAGFTQSEEYLLLFSDVLKFNPDRVLLFFLPDNDIGDVTPELANDKMRPFFTVDNTGALLLDTSFVETEKFRMKEKINPFKQNSALLSLITERYNAFVRQKSMTTIKNSTRERGIGENVEKPKYRINDFLNLASSNPDTLYQKAYELNKRLIIEISEICRNRGIDFDLVLIGGYHAMNVNTVGYRAVDPAFDPDWFDQDLICFSRDNNINFINLRRIFSDRITEGNVSLFWTHWNYAGHRLVAEVIGEYLRESL